ncbi:hypothetical protein K490DRAFT_55353 [Saccharata proteae CBS 121410]|uniref:Uncharacterized protein n=1 Tax=Saccharata proteae CBS 121410 TaxID=1314787 RepID=A0A6A5YAI9_9PEZI|nr:hypothetical protein K490DRAFT_55353 [Saccharata proteae CBS 121410]
MHIAVPKSPAPSSGAPSPSTPFTPSTSYMELGDVGKGGDRMGASTIGASTNSLNEVKPVTRKTTNLGDVEDLWGSWWLFELSSWVLSAIFLAVIIAVLATCDNKPLPEWPFSITLNTFLSVFASLMKACMVIPLTEGISQLKWLWFNKAGKLKDIQTFDEASRGTWGSVKLLVSTRGVHLAKLGAVLTVVALAADPFVQQIVAYKHRQVPNYTSFTSGSIMALKSPPLSMKAAIYTGIYDEEEDSVDNFDITPSCATGNCTWSQPYMSLGVCTKCANVTSSLNETCAGKVGTTSHTCNYTLPNGLLLNGVRRGGAYYSSTGGTDTVNFNGDQSTISALSSIRGLHDASSQHLFGAVANECVLYFCVNTYNASVDSGTLNETILDSWSNATSMTYGSDITMTPPGANETYTVGAYAWQALAQEFWNMFAGTVTGDIGEETSDNDIVRAIYDLGTGSAASGTPNNGENKTMASLAASMTKLIRTSASSSSGSSVSKRSSLGSGGGNSTVNNGTHALGITWQSETYVHVRWPWITLPVALEILTLVFLIGTIWRSNVAGVAVWKSSTLALLQCRLVSDVEEDSGGSPNGGRRTRDDVLAWGSGKLHELNRWATKSEVSFRRTETGLSEFIHRRKI